MNAPAVPSHDFAGSAAAFRRFFVELREAFLERDALFTQVELALLCREHVLVIGPPGTAKSAIASAVLGRLLDETTGRPSLFSKQLAENTVQTDLIGPVDFKVLTETGRTEYLTDEGMLGSVHAFLDEVFDGRDMLLRSILNVLHERELKHGRRVTPGRCECAVMTSNRYLSEVLQRSPETLQAFADRISFICFAPKSFARKTSRALMLERSQVDQRAPLHERLSLQQLDVLQEAVSAVEVPPQVAEGLEVLADLLEKELLAQVTRLPDYVPTKYFSQRSMVKAQWALKAAVVRDRVYRRPERRLVAELADLEPLRSFFLLGGPTGEELELLLKAAVDPRERAQLEIIRVENKAFDEAIAKLPQLLADSAEKEAAELGVRELQSSADAVARSWNSNQAGTAARSLKARLVPGPRHPSNRAPLLKVVDALLTGLEQRLAKGAGGTQAERNGAQLTQAVADVVDLARRVPESTQRVATLGEDTLRFAAQSGQLSALAGEAAEFDDSLQLVGIVALAANLSEELSALGELVQVARTACPGLPTALGPDLPALRSRVAVALRNRARRAFATPVARKGDPFEHLSTDSRRLKELETALVELSPDMAGLREAMLAPLAQAYAADVLGEGAFIRVEQLARAARAVAEQVDREGGSGARALQAVRPLIEERVAAVAQSLATLPRARAPDARTALSGEAHTLYRELGANAPDGEAAQARSIGEALGAPLPTAVIDAIAAAEVTSLAGRVKYLQLWLTEALGALPRVVQLTDEKAANAAFDALIRSRFPMLVTREGELVRLRGALERVEFEPGERGALARNVKATLERVEHDFQAYARRVIDARTPRS